MSQLVFRCPPLVPCWEYLRNHPGASHGSKEAKQQPSIQLQRHDCWETLIMVNGFSTASFQVFLISTNHDRTEPLIRPIPVHMLNQENILWSFPNSLSSASFGVHGEKHLVALIPTKTTAGSMEHLAIIPSASSPHGSYYPLLFECYSHSKTHLRRGS